MKGRGQHWQRVAARREDGREDRRGDRDRDDGAAPASLALTRRDDFRRFPCDEHDRELESESEDERHERSEAEALRGVTARGSCARLSFVRPPRPPVASRISVLDFLSRPLG